MRFSTILSFVVVTFLNFSFSQVSGQGFTTTQGGVWENGGVWGAALYPTATNSTSITVNHPVSINNDIVLDQLTIGTSGSLTIASGVTVTIANETGTDITNNGQLIVNGNLVFQDGVTHAGLTASNTTFNAGSSYEHRYTNTEGILPLATWNSTSSLKITGYTTRNAATPSGNWGQVFGNVEWNCPLQTSVFDLNGHLRTITGNLKVSSTGNTGGLRFATIAVATTPFAVNIGKNVVIEGSSQLGFTTTIGLNLTIGENLIQSSSRDCWLTTTGVVTLNLGGDLIVSGTQNFGLGNNASAATVINLGGSIIVSSEGDLKTTNTPCTFNFNNGKTHNIVVSTNNSFDGNFIYNIAANDVVDIAAGSFIQGSDLSQLHLYGTLIVRDTDGTSAIRTTTTTNAGAIRIAARNFYSGSRVVLAGSAIQTIGNGFPTTSGVNIVIDNPNGVNLSAGAAASTLSNIVVTNGKLNLNRGAWTVNGNVTIENSGSIELPSSSTARSLSIAGGLTINDGGSLLLTSGTTTEATLTLQGQIGGNGSIITTGNNVVLNVTGSSPINATLPLTSGITLKSLTLNRSSGMLSLPYPVSILNTLSITGADLATTSNLTVNNLTLGSDSRLIFDEVTLTLQGAITNNGGLLYGNNGNLSITGTNAAGNIFFSEEGMFLNSLFLNKSNTGTSLTLETPLFIMGNLYIRDGVFQNNSSLFLESSEVRIHSDGSFTGLAPEDGFYDLVYEGTGSLTTGPEARVPLNNFTQLNSSTVNLGGNLEVSQVLAINAGTLGQQNYNITAGSFNNEGTFNGTALGYLRIKNGFRNAGTFNHNAGVLQINGFTGLDLVSPTVFSNMSITSSGYLTAPSQLELVGSLTNDGNFDHNNGKVLFVGTGVQYIQGSNTIVFNNIDINNTYPQGVQVQSNHSFEGILTLGPNAVFDPDGSSNTSVFTLLSTNDSPAQDAAIAALPSGASIIGDITVQRYMATEGTNGNLYRYISSPVVAATVADIQNEIPVSGTFTGASVCASCNANASLFWFDETGVQSLPNGYVAFPATSNSETFEQGRGYSLFVRGSLSSNVWDVRGVVNQGTIALPVSYTNSGHPSGNGWNLVGNPYPSAIDWNSSGWTKSNISGSIYVKDNGSGQFASWNGTVGTNGGSRYIALGQAFWVQSVNDSPTLIIEETAKAPNASTEFYRTAPLTNILRAIVQQGNISDETIIHFRNDASNDFDQRHDARKMPNTGMFNLSSKLSNGDLLSINSLQQLSCRQELPLDLSGATRGSYVLKFDEIESFDADVLLILKDRFLNKEIDIRSTRTYSFDVTTNAESTGGNRFVIVVDPNGVNRASHEITSNESCVGGNAEITIVNSQINVKYSALMGNENVSSILEGNGGELVLKVDPSRLALGSNEITILTDNNLCNTQENFTAQIVVKSHPTLIMEELNGEFSVDHGFDKYEWYFNNEVIDGETSNSIITTIPGVYTVTATMINGCSASASREKVITGLEIPSENRIRTYPNPVTAHELLVVEMSDEVALNFNGLRLVDQIGRHIEVVYKREGKKLFVDVNNLSSGVYLVWISNSKGGYFTKIIKG
jgi:hypothetical protein